MFRPSSWSSSRRVFAPCAYLAVTKNLQQLRERPASTIGSRNRERFKARISQLRTQSLRRQPHFRRGGAQFGIIKCVAITTTRHFVDGRFGFGLPIEQFMRSDRSESFALHLGHYEENSIWYCRNRNSICHAGFSGTAIATGDLRLELDRHLCRRQCRLWWDERRGQLYGQPERRILILSGPERKWRFWRRSNRSQLPNQLAGRGH